MSAFKVEFATVRELEKKTFRVFGYGGSAFGIGLLLSLMGLVIIGVPLMVVSCIALMVAVAWVSVLGKEATARMACPYCASANEVYQSRKAFSCDICGRPVNVTENGEPVAAEPIDVVARF